MLQLDLRPAEEASSDWSAQMSSFYCSNHHFWWRPHPQCYNFQRAWHECNTGEGQEPSSDYVVPPAWPILEVLGTLLLSLWWEESILSPWTCGLEYSVALFPGPLHVPQSSCTLRKLIINLFCHCVY